MLLPPNTFGDRSAQCADPVVNASPLGAEVRSGERRPFPDGGWDFRVMFDAVAHTVLRKLSISIDETYLQIKVRK